MPSQRRAAGGGRAAGGPSQPRAASATFKARGAESATAAAATKALGLLINIQSLALISFPMYLANPLGSKGWG